MNLRSTIAVLIALATTFTTTAGFANDGVFGGSGGSLAPIKETRVRMASEDIKLSHVPSKKNPLYTEWHVEALYKFENTSNETVTLQVGFPELPCSGDCGENESGNYYSFKDLETRVRGKKVKHRTGTLKPKDIPKWKPDFGKVHLFDVTFKPKETVTITHTYRNDFSGSVDGHSAHYVTRTGALWNGPIGKATFTIDFDETHFYTTYPREYKLVQRQEKPAPKGSRRPSKWVYVFEMENWTPQHDLDIHFGNMAAAMPLDCPPNYDMDDELNALHYNTASKAAREKILQKIASKIFSGRSAEQIATCRNLIYATHGYPFKKKKWNDLFYQPPFQTYCHICGPMDKPEDPYSIPMTRFYHMPNPNYSPSFLSEQEQLYIRLAKMAEAAKKKK